MPKIRIITSSLVLALLNELCGIDWHEFHQNLLSGSSDNSWARNLKRKLCDNISITTEPIFMKIVPFDSAWSI